MAQPRASGAGGSGGLAAADSSNDSDSDFDAEPHESGAPAVTDRESDQQRQARTSAEEVLQEEARDFVAWVRQQGTDAPLWNFHTRAEVPQDGSAARVHHVDLTNPTLRCNGCRHEDNPCDTCLQPGAGGCSVGLNGPNPCRECEAGKWFRYANHLRLKVDICTATENVIRIVEDGLRGSGDTDYGWSWSQDQNCLCRSCVRLGPRLNTLFLYTERLVRKESWFTDADLQLRDARAGAGSSHSPPLQLPEVLQRAVDHWKDFFEPLQRLAEYYGARPAQDLSRAVFCDRMPAIPASLRDPSTDYMNQDCHRTVAALNHLRCMADSSPPPPAVQALQDAISHLDIDTATQGFKTDYARFNFEGTVEDNYCFGSRGPIREFGDARGEFASNVDGGVKWYVGTTQDKVRRHGEHAGQDPRTEGRSSYYIRKLTGRVLPPPDDFGGWRVAAREGHGDEAWKVESSCFTRMDEDKRAELMAIVFGQRHVRGGVYPSLKLSNVQRAFLEMKRRHVLNLCFKCGQHVFNSTAVCPGGDEFFNAYMSCPVHTAHVQPASDDEALLTFRQLRMSYTPDDPCLPHAQSMGGAERARVCAAYHFERARSVVGALCSNYRLAPSQAVMLSSGVEESDGADSQEGNDAGRNERSSEWYQLVRAIWPPQMPVRPGSIDAGGPAGGEVVDEADAGDGEADDGDGVAAQLRPAQKKALRAVVCPHRHNLVLCLPTAYGKTRIFLTAAVHEVLRGRGRAVVFLPYKALMSDITRTFEEITHGLMGQAGRSAHLPPPTRYDIDPRVRGTATAYGGSMYVLDPVSGSAAEDHMDRRLRKITWTRWQGKTGDGNMREHETTDEFKHADIVLATPDKWMLPASKSPGADACDSFLRAFEDKAASFGLAIIDEAHQFSGVLGGSTRELLKRMRLLCELEDAAAAPGHVKKPFRVILASATIPQAERFAQMLLPKQTCCFVHADEDRQALQPQQAESSVTDAMLTDLEDSARRDGRHRLLLFYPNKLRVQEVCRHVLTYDVLGWQAGEQGEQDEHTEHGVRRVLLFCDSKQEAARFVQRLRTQKFKREAGWADQGFEVFATPYNGDCSNMHRGVYERLFGGWVKRKQLHVIVATSALEAGVNICGPDVIIILNAAACSRSSLVQRIGRGGRVGGRPAVVIIGVDPTELPQLVEEREEGDIERYLFDNQETPAVSVTRAMVVHSAVQHVRNLRKLQTLRRMANMISGDIARSDLAKLFCDEAHMYRRCTSHEHLDGFEPHGVCSLASPGTETVAALLAKLEVFLIEEGKVETTYFGENNSARGIGMGTLGMGMVSLVKVTRDGRFERPYGPRNNEEQLISNDFVHVARLDVLRSLHLAHPDAHYLTPHGCIYRVLGHVFKGRPPAPGENSDWLKKLHLVKMYPVSRAQHDEHYYCFTRSDWGSHLRFVEGTSARIAQTNASQLRQGKFESIKRWNGFTYHNIFNNAEVGAQVTPAALKQARSYSDSNPFFFEPTCKWEVGGLEWRITLPGDAIEVFNTPAIRTMVRNELWLRVACTLGCTVQQIQVHLLGHGDDIFADEERDNQDGSVVMQEAGLGVNEIALQIAEWSTSGLPREAFRRMDKVLQDPTQPRDPAFFTQHCPDCHAQATVFAEASQAAQDDSQSGVVEASTYLLENRNLLVSLWLNTPTADEVDANKFDVLRAVDRLRGLWQDVVEQGLLRPEYDESAMLIDSHGSSGGNSGLGGGGGANDESQRVQRGRVGDMVGQGGVDGVRAHGGDGDSSLRNHPSLPVECGARNRNEVQPGGTSGGLMQRRCLRKPPICNLSPLQSMPSETRLMQCTFSAYFVPLIFAAIGILHPEDVQAWKQLINSLLTSNQPFRGELLSRHPWLQVHQACHDGTIFELLLKAVREALCLLGPTLFHQQLNLQDDGTFSDADVTVLERTLTADARGRPSTYVQPVNQQHILDPRPQDATDDLKVALQKVEDHYQQLIPPSFLCPYLMMAGMQFSQRDRSRC